MPIETVTATARLSWAMNSTRTSPLQGGAAPAARANQVVMWILLALGLLLMLVSAAEAQQASVTRVDRFNGTLRPGQTLHVENVSGDVVAAPGKEFSAVVTVQVSAPSGTKAQQVLDATRIVTEHDDEGWSLETHWPGGRGGGHGDHRGSLCSGCKVTAKYELVIPAGVTAELQTVNGDVRVRDCNGELKLSNVNGSIEARGVRASLEANTVNGRIDAVVAAIPRDASFGLQSVNGALLLTLPKDAKFDLSASTMNGTIASTFPLPVRDEVVEVPRGGKGGNRGEHDRRVVVHSEDGETEVDLGQLEEELRSTMQDAEAAVEEGTREGARDGMREAQREMRRIRVVDPRQEYSGSVGNGGADVKLETLNGAIAVLAEGTREADAKRLVTRRNSFSVTIPEVRVRVAPPVVVVHPAPPPPAAPPPGAPSAHAAPPAPPEPPSFDGEVVRGDVSGDFLSTTAGSYRVGRVSGRVKILTHSGEIRLGSAGAGADLKTFGGDIIVGPVTGDLKASTSAGDIRAQTVTGSLLADTAGGDVRAERVGANLDAKTAGGDIVALRVGGGVRAVTAGGDVRIGVLSSTIPGGITVHNSGGDVTLWIPADSKADVDLSVSGVDEDESAIRSDFSDVSVNRRQGSQHATAKLNGGGEKIVVRTTSGTIRLRKGSAP